MSQPRYTVSAEELKDEFLRRRYCQLLSQPEIFPSDENWNYLISKRMAGLGAGLYHKYLVAWLTDEHLRNEFHEAALTHFPEYLETVDRNYAISIIYNDSESSPEAFKDLVYRCQLFDAEAIGNIIDNGNPGLAVDLLGAYQPVYDGDTIDAMRFLASKIEKLPDIGEICMKRGIFKTEEVYICPDGHTNPVDTVYCRHQNCGKDIKGLTETQRNLIEEFKKRIIVLSEMLA